MTSRIVGIRVDSIYFMNMFKAPFSEETDGQKRNLQSLESNAAWSSLGYRRADWLVVGR